MTTSATVPGHELELLIATSNRGKLPEIQAAFDGLPIKLRRLDEFCNVLPVEEVGQTYRDNAILKALSYSRQTGLFALADDSGLEVDALGGGPGPLSARFSGAVASDTERIQKLLLALSQHPNSERTSRFVCSMVLAGWPPDVRPFPEVDPRVLVATEGICEGFIADGPRGRNGFGYDPVFMPAGYLSTFAEMPSQVKNKISHRARALASMREFLELWLGSNLTVNKTGP